MDRAGKVAAVRVGSPATTSCKPRQARKGAAVAARLGAGVGLTRASIPPEHRVKRELYGFGVEMAAAAVRGARRPAARRPGARELARRESAASRLFVHRHAWGRQDHGRAIARQSAELRDRRGRGAVRRVCILQGDRRGSVRGPHRSRRGLSHTRGRHSRVARQRSVRADARTLQGVPHRRGAHALESFVQCTLEDARGAAAAREVSARDHGSPKSSR